MIYNNDIVERELPSKNAPRKTITNTIIFLKCQCKHTFITKIDANAYSFEISKSTLLNVQKNLFI